MIVPKRPCLECRVLIEPTKDNPSYCMQHKPLIKKAQRNCVQCGTAGNKSNRLTVDHIIPISKGGTHKIFNLRVLCQVCHRKRRGIDHR